MFKISVALCRIEKGFVRDIDGNCVCAPGSAIDIYGECKECRPEEGYKIDETGRCVCALERGFIIDERGRCICPVEHGYKLTPYGECIVESRTPQCVTDDDCADSQRCETQSKICVDACYDKVCGINALCNATKHTPVCICITGYVGNPEIQCSKFNHQYRISKTKKIFKIIIIFFLFQMKHHAFESIISHHQKWRSVV